MAACPFYGAGGQRAAIVQRGASSSRTQGGTMPAFAQNFLNLRRCLTFLRTLTASGAVVLLFSHGNAASTEAWCMFHPGAETSAWRYQALLVINSTSAGDALEVRVKDVRTPPER